MIRDLTRQEVEDILHGAALFGGGGGGALAEGFGLLDLAEAEGRGFRLAALDDVPDEAVLCTPYLLGAISETAAEEAQAYAGLPQAARHPLLLAYGRLEAHLGAPIHGTIACELGGSNTAVPFFLAAMAGGVTIDADPAGRAVPEITHSGYFLEGLPASPIVAANGFGELALLEHVADDARAERLVRALCHVSRNDIAAIDHALPAGLLRPALLPGTLSRAGVLGALWRDARHSPRDLPDRIAEAAGGCLAFRGVVTESHWRTEAGFTLGQFSIQGLDAFEGQVYRIDLKNENLVGWRDGALHATIPEIITVLDTETGEIVTNPHATQGRQVAVVILPAPALFLTPRGLEIFGPTYAGLETPFRSAL